MSLFYDEKALPSSVCILLLNLSDITIVANWDFDRFPLYIVRYNPQLVDRINIIIPCIMNRYLIFIELPVGKIERNAVENALITDLVYPFRLIRCKK